LRHFGILTKIRTNRKCDFIDFPMAPKHCKGFVDRLLGLKLFSRPHSNH
jgi:hypothetical protein